MGMVAIILTQKCSILILFIYPFIDCWNFGYW